MNGGWRKPIRDAHFSKHPILSDWGLTYVETEFISNKSLFRNLSIKYPLLYITLKVAYTSGPIFEKIIKRYPIFPVQIIKYQIDQKHKYNILLVKFYFQSFKNGYFVFSPYGIMLIFTRL